MPIYLLNSANCSDFANGSKMRNCYLCAPRRTVAERKKRLCSRRNPRLRFAGKFIESRIRFRPDCSKSLSKLISNPRHVGIVSEGWTMRLRQKLVVGLWMLVTGIAMTGWLAGLAWTTAWLIERITS